MSDPIEELLGMSVEDRSNLKHSDPRLSFVASMFEELYSLPPGLLRAIKFAENSGFDKEGRVVPSNNTSHATSPVGAQGLMQFMPATRKLQGGMFDHNVLDPIESMDAAAKYLQYTLKNQYKGNVAAAIADYNGGPRQARLVMEGKLPKAKETRDYLKKAENFFEMFEQENIME